MALYLKSQHPLRHAHLPFSDFSLAFISILLRVLSADFFFVLQLCELFESREHFCFLILRLIFIH